MKWRNATQEELRSHIVALIESDVTLSQKQVARESGLSSAAVNRWLQDKYDGDDNAVAAKLIAWLDSRELRQQTASHLPQAPAWVSTPTGDRIVIKLTAAQLTADFGVVYGGAGVGKTSACKHYLANNPNVWLATMSRDCSTVAAVLEEIAEAFGIRSEHAISSSKMRREICKKMRGTRGLLIIDEAQHLTTDGLEEVRSIYDATEIGVVLSGNEAVYSRITGGSRAAHFAQLYSRIGTKLRLNKPSDGDVQPLAAAFGITGAAEQQLLCDIAQKPGALRGMVKIARLASMIATGDGVAITSEHIRAAWRDLGGE